MPPKTHFTIPLGNTVDFVTRSRWSMQDIQTTECVVPQLSKKKTSTKPSAQQHDHGDVPQTLNDTEERYPLHIHEDQEDPNDVCEVDIGHSQSQANTNGAMVGSQGQIPPSITGDGGGHPGSKVLCLLPSIPQKHPIPLDVPMDRQSLYASIIIFTGICTVPWPSRPSMSNDSGAAEKAHCSKKKSMQTKPASHNAINEETSPSPELPDISNAYLPAESLHYLSDPLFGNTDPLIDTLHGNSKRLRTEASGNPLLTVVHQSGVFNMEVLYCICPNAGEKDKQLFQSGMFPSSFKQIETAFTFSALEYFLTDNLECKTMAQQYFLKLQGITNQMFPHTVPNLYRQLLRASRQWRDLRNRMQSGRGHQDDDGIDGSMAIFCPACPQPGINLPDDWKIRYNEYSFMILMTISGDNDVPLSPRMVFMANPEAYKTHLKSYVTGIGATAFCHVFFVPTSVVDFQKGERQVNMDYSLCKALSYNVEDIPVALVMYDIMCQYGVHLSNRVEKSPELSIANSLELWTGIGLFHIHGHQDSCLPHYSPSYISGAKQVDGEIIETFSIHIEEVEENGMKGNERQHFIIKVMLMHKVATIPCRDTIEAHFRGGGDPTTHGQTSWIASGIRIQELQLAINTNFGPLVANITTDATIHSSLHIAIPKHSSHSLDQPSSLASDGSGVDSPNPEIFQSFFHHPWDGTGLPFPWLQVCSFQTQVRSAKTLSRLRLMHGLLLAVWILQYMSMPAFTAWHVMPSGTSDWHIQMLWNIQRLPHRTFMLQPLSLDRQAWTTQHTAVLDLELWETSEDEGTWMDDFERVHCCVQSTVEHWLEDSSVTCEQH
ncbi:hypothetical protein EI94DRAFT_1704047, partial [Lactarius quietus]